MLASLTRKELLSNLLTMRLVVALVFTVSLSALTSLIGSLEYSRNFEAYRDEARRAQQGLEEVEVYRQVFSSVVVPPEPVTILAHGITEASGHSSRVRPWNIDPAPWPIGNLDDDRMRTLERIDLTTVIALLLSFLGGVRR